MRGGVGATITPYTIFSFILWTMLLYTWMAVGLPRGPGGPLSL